MCNLEKESCCSMDGMLLSSQSYWFEIRASRLQLKWFKHLSVTYKSIILFRTSLINQMTHSIKTFAPMKGKPKKINKQLHNILLVLNITIIHLFNTKLSVYTYHCWFKTYY